MKPMGARGSVPHLLRLKPEDMAHTGSGKFTKVSGGAQGACAPARGGVRGGKRP